METILRPEEKQAFQAQLVELRVEHRDLDDAIHQLERNGRDDLQVRRLKKRKLLLKDQITWIERQLEPDVSA